LENDSKNVFLGVNQMQSFFSFKKKKSLTLFLIASEKKTGGTIAQNIRPN
jgi:hypothetical protein